MAQLPGASFGTYTVKGETCQAHVYAALQAGFRGVDTASFYKNEEEVGRAICSSGVAREEIFLTTKLSPQEATHGHDVVIASCMQCLHRLQQPYLDCYMMHWPGIAKLRPEDPENISKRQAAWYAMEQLQRQGYCRHIAVSNFAQRHLDSISAGVGDECSGGGRAAAVLPLMNQMELHPLCRQQSIVETCHARGILVQQYSPLAMGEACLMEHAVLADMARRFDDVFKGSVARLCLLWGVAHRYRTVVRCSPHHLQDNVELFDRYGYLSTAADSFSASACEASQQRLALSQAVAAVDEVLRDLPDRHVCWFSDRVA